MTPLMVRLNNLQLRFMRVGARLHWGLRNGEYPEGLGDPSSTDGTIHLLDEWFYFERAEPRLGAAYLPPLAKGVGIFHYRLGDAS